MTIAQFSQRIWLYFVMHQNIAVIWWHGYCCKKYFGATLDTLALFYFHNPYVLEITVGKCICFSPLYRWRKSQIWYFPMALQIDNRLFRTGTEPLVNKFRPEPMADILYTIIFHNRNCLIELFLPFISSMMPLSLSFNKYGVLNALTPSKMTLILMYSLQWR